MLNNKHIYYKQLIREFDRIRLTNIKKQKALQEAIYAEIPRIKKIDETLNSNGIYLVKCMLEKTSNVDDLSQRFRTKNTTLIAEKRQLLMDHNYAATYLDLQYECPKCKDEGFIDGQPCKCFEQALINLSCQQSNLASSLKTDTFAHFDFHLYSSEVSPSSRETESSDASAKNTKESISSKMPKTQISPRENIQNIYDNVIQFTENFPKYQNMVFVGTAGLGKTFLCTCIANDLLNKGFTVLYLSAIQLFKCFDNVRFNRKEATDAHRSMFDDIFTADLLIIDDLGTELSTNYINPDLFNVLNSRHLKLKPTIISTNTAITEWRHNYSERIESRLLGNYAIYTFIGSDIRVNKKYAKAP